MNIYYELNGDLFVWNADKAEKNLHKHGVRFEEAATVFSDPLFILTDASHNDEARDAAIGFDVIGRLLYVVHIEIEDSLYPHYFRPPHRTQGGTQLCSLNA